MKSVGTTTAALFGPALVCGLPIALLADCLLGRPEAAALVVVACLATATVSMLLILRNLSDASAQLRRPELRGNSQQGTGVYAEFLQEAVTLLDGFEQDVREAEQNKTEFEAHAHVRQEEKERLESALAALDDPVLITDTRDQIEFCNASADSLLRSSSGGLENQTIIPDVGRFPQLARLLRETRSRKSATDRRKTELDLQIGGETIAYGATATNIYDEDETLIGVVTLLKDIRNERAEQARQADFVSSVCHELKTPMSSIRAFTEMLIDGEVEDPKERVEVYGFIEAQVDRLTRMVENMLNLARIQSGVVKLQRSDCELSDVLQKAFDVVRPMAEEKQIRMTAELSDMYLAVHVDRDLFGQAIINLLSNAVKYTPAGGEVRLQSRMEEDRAVIEVRDTGMGIPEESLPRIFDRFYRVPENKKAASGTGLGLAFVHYITTELHNGEIAVESAVGEGTRFSISIPLGHRDGRKRKAENEKRKAESGKRIDTVKVEEQRTQSSFIG